MIDLPERLAQAVAERVVALVVDALDVNALLSRVDIDALLGRIDVDTLLERVDFEQLVKRIDLASTMSATATGAADDAVEALRRTAVRGDELTAHWVRRLVRRP